MLKYITKKIFIESVRERRFVVQHVKGNKYAVYMISQSVGFEGMPQQYSLPQVVNPETKDGLWNQTGGGYNKAHACIEDIARYVDNNAEDKDDDSEEESCAIFFMYKQRLNEI
jgi:hypothetical protein